jgi:uncharacterized SAM-binding protein YcdF (DUF218 family)
LLLMTAIGSLRFSAHQKHRTRRLLHLGILGLFLVSWLPMAWLVSIPFEARYSGRPIPDGDGQAIVVLSGNVLPPRPERPTPLADRDTYERCQYAAWLYKNWRNVPVLACGGAGPDGGEPFSLAMRRILEGEGVPASMIWTEEKSRSTHENAAFGAELLRSRGILRVALVTEAYHMPRSEKCFRKQGIQVIPSPCGFRRFDFRVQEFLPDWEAIDQHERTLHETVGLLWYWSRGWI